jgi:TetR/AcrR family transcriptional regulator
MPEMNKKPGRIHNAEGARRLILDAAEEAFANDGYAGARVDDIAAQAGYNKGLLFRYFGDKLNLYTEVLKRADQDTNAVRAQALAPIFSDESIATDPQRFRGFLENLIWVNFDYLVDHPRVFRILQWEMADQWQTYTQISAEFSQEQLEPFNRVCRRAFEAGVLRSDFIPIIQLTIAPLICQIYLAYIPIYRIASPGEDLTSPPALSRAREFIIDLLVSGIFREPAEEKTGHRGINANQ